MSPINKNPLGLVMNIIEAMGLEVTYSYDNLVFVAHNAFLLEMDEKPDILNLYFNEQSELPSRPSLQALLSRHAQVQGLRIVKKGTFTLEQLPDHAIKIHFSPDAI
jgi:hypothetical protein